MTETTAFFLFAALAIFIGGFLAGCYFMLILLGRRFRSLLQMLEEFKQRRSEEKTHGPQ